MRRSVRGYGLRSNSGSLTKFTAMRRAAKPEKNRQYKAHNKGTPLIFGSLIGYALDRADCNLRGHMAL
jgi:hypothetical protein